MLYRVVWKYAETHPSVFRRVLIGTCMCEDSTRGQRLVKTGRKAEEQRKEGRMQRRKEGRKGDREREKEIGMEGKSERERQKECKGRKNRERESEKEKERERL